MDPARSRQLGTYNIICMMINAERAIRVNNDGAGTRSNNLKWHSISEKCSAGSVLGGRCSFRKC